MRTKKIILWFVFVSIFILMIQSVNATAIINNEIKKDSINKIDSEISKLKIKQIKINNIIESLADSTITSLHELFMLFWDMIGILIGHNIVSLLFARLCCCWIITPIVCLYELTNINISGGGFMKYFNQYLEEFNASSLLYTFGLMAIFVLPFVYLLAFCLALAEVIGDGFNIEGGIIERIMNDLRYIYEPDIEYEKLDTDLKIEFYSGGISWITVIFSTLCIIKFVDRNDRVEKKDGIDKKPLLEFILDLIKMVLNFILKILNREPIPL